MKNNLYSKKMVFVVIAIIISIIFFTLAARHLLEKGNGSQRYMNNIEINWGIQLSKDAKVIYGIDNSGFLGDGERYNVLSYDDDREISSAFEWKKGRNELLETKVKEISKGLSIDEKYALNFAGEYMYYIKGKDDSSKIYMVYVPSLKRVTVIEDIY